MAATAATSNLTTARLGTRGSVALGLALVAAALGVLSTATTGTPFWQLTLELAVAGAGMGLVMAPASLTTISAMPPERAAMASSINSVVRELGGVLGIAVVGSTVSAGYHHQLQASGTNGLAAQDLPAAHVAAAHLPINAALNLIDSANRAFTSAMNDGLRVCVLIAALGALAALHFLPPKRSHDQEKPVTSSDLISALDENPNQPEVSEAK